MPCSSTLLVLLPGCSELCTPAVDAWATKGSSAAAVRRRKLLSGSAQDLPTSAPGPYPLLRRPLPLCSVPTAPLLSRLRCEVHADACEAGDSRCSAKGPLALGGRVLQTPRADRGRGTLASAWFWCGAGGSSRNGSLAQARVRLSASALLSRCARPLHRLSANGWLSGQLASGRAAGWLSTRLAMVLALFVWLVGA